MNRNEIGSKYCFRCGKSIDVLAEICPKCGVRQSLSQQNMNKNRFIAALLAFFLGGFGIHKFYLGRNGQGILYLLFVWTLIPSFISVIDGVHYLILSDEAFTEKFQGNDKGKLGL